MNPHQRLFLIQAKADMVVFERFWKDSTLPACHALHYLQMATELLGKAMPGRTGPGQTRTAHLWASCEALATNRRKINWGMRARMRIGDT